MLPLRTLRSTVAAVFVLAALAGCASSGSDSVVGDWGVVTKGEPSLTIEPDGSFHGTDGCNDLKGKGTISGDTITFGPFASLTVACEGVRPWLNLGASARAEGDKLVVLRGDGDTAGTLARR